MSESYKKRLAWVLMGCMCLAVGGALTWLHGQGTQTCENLVANLPTDQSSKPCGIVYRTAPQGPVVRRVHLQWRAQRLKRARFARETQTGTGDATTISCTTWGRIVLPIHHYRHWLTLSVLQELGNRDGTSWTVIDQRSEQRGAAADRRVLGYDADGDGELDKIQVTTRQKNAGGHVSTFRYFNPDSGREYRHVEVRRNLEAKVIERRILQSKYGRSTHISYDYNCSRPGG